MAVEGGIQTTDDDANFVGSAVADEYPWAVARRPNGGSPGDPPEQLWRALYELVSRMMSNGEITCEEPGLSLCRLCNRVMLSDAECIRHLWEKHEISNSVPSPAGAGYN
jgi:hypothetical protein